MFIYLIFFVKIIYILLALGVIYYKKTNNKKEYNTFLFWKHHVEFIFIALMSLLLVMLFNPFYNNMKLINHETKVLLFVYGIIILLTAEWGLFFKESYIFKVLKNDI
jgi:hypothetical protein